MGLVARVCWSGNVRRNVYLDSAPSFGFGIAVEAAEVTSPGNIEPLIRELREPAGGTQFTVRQENGTLIIDGSREQIDAVARLLEQMKVK